MLKELYVKPEIKSEMLEPGALAGGGSGGGGDADGFLRQYGGPPPIALFNPFFGFCCS